MHVLWSVIAVLLIAAGLLGAIVPALPGIPLIFGGLWLLGDVSILRSAHVGVSAWAGLLLGTLVKLVASVTMVALFEPSGGGTVFPEWTATEDAEGAASHRD